MKRRPKDKVIYIFFYCVKHIVNKMKKKQTTSSKRNYLQMEGESNQPE
jgi:hypothetical protein